MTDKRSMNELDRYRGFEADKRKLPAGMTPKQYEQAVKALAEKWRV